MIKSKERGKMLLGLAIFIKKMVKKPGKNTE
jgi:hypothetical protein